MRLLATADVLVETFRPQVMAKLGTAQWLATKCPVRHDSTLKTCGRRWSLLCSLFLFHRLVPACLAQAVSASDRVQH